MKNTPYKDMWIQIGILVPFFNPIYHLNKGFIKICLVQVFPDINWLLLEINQKLLYFILLTNGFKTDWNFLFGKIGGKI